MMKHGGIVFVVAALVALTGCSASPAEPLTAETSTPASASASPSVVAKAAPAANPDAQIEKQFTEFALMRADVHSVSQKPAPKAIVAALHAFCEDGDPFELSKSPAYNENLDLIAEDTYCPYLSK